MCQVTKCPGVGDSVKVYRGKYTGAVGKVLQLTSIWGERGIKWSSARIDIGGAEVWVRTTYITKEERVG